VAAGGLLLAAGETWQITRHYGWPVWLFWLLMVVMAAVSLRNTTVRVIGTQHPRDPAAAESRVRRDRTGREAYRLAGGKPAWTPDLGC
jgi:hypothetical protein